MAYARQYPTSSPTSFDFYLRYSPFIPSSIQAHYSKTPTYLNHILSNPALDPSILSSFLSRPRTRSASMAIASRRLSLSDMVSFLDTESSTSPLNALFEANLPSTPDELNTLLPHLNNPRLLWPLYLALRADPRLAPLVGRLLPPERKLSYLADLPSVPNSEALSAIRLALSTNARPTRLVYSLSRLFDLHANTLDSLQDPSLLSDTRLALAAAASINLTEAHAFTLLDLGANLSPDILRSPKHIDPLAPRCPSKVLAALVRNPVLSPRILRYLSRSPHIDPKLARLARRRYNSSDPVLRPGFAGLTESDFEFVLELAHRRTYFSPAHPIPYWTTTWAVALARNAPASCYLPLIELLCLHHSRDDLGPIAHAHLLDRLCDSTGSTRPSFYPISSPFATSFSYPAIPLPPFSTFVITEDAIHLVLDAPAQRVPASPITSPRSVSLFAHIGGRYLKDNLRDSLARWELFEDFASHSGDSSLEQVVTVITRLARD